MADELLEIADDGSNDWMMRQHSGDQSYAANGEHIQRSRLRLDTRKWLLSKALPKIYGDKLPVETNTEPQTICQVMQRLTSGSIGIAAFAKRRLSPQYARRPSTPRP